MSRLMFNHLNEQLPLQVGGSINALSDSAMALFIEALRLNGRLNVTLSLGELQLLEVARRELSGRGLCVTFDVDETEKLELFTGISREKAKTFMLRRSRVVYVQFKSNAHGCNELTWNIPFFTSAGK